MLLQKFTTFIIVCGSLLLLTIGFSCNNGPDDTPHYSDNCKTDFAGFPEVPRDFTSIPLPAEIERAMECYFINELHGLVFSDQYDIWATDDGGYAWHQVYDGPARAFGDITFLDSLTGYASAWTNHEGCLMKTTDGGSTWHLINITPKGSLSKITFADTLIGFAVLYPILADGSFSKSYFAKTIDGGSHWEEVAGVEEGITTISQVKVFSNGFGFVPGDKGKFYLTHDMGETWSPVETGLEYIFWDQAINADTIFVSSFDSFLRSTDGGMSWKEISKYFVEAGHFFSGTDGLTVQTVASDWLTDVAENCNAFLTTSNGGETWMEGPPSYSFSVNEISFINNRTGFMLYNNEIYRFERE